MGIYPEFQDSYVRVKLKKDDFPFFISISTVKSTKLHHHDFVELSYVFDGSGYETINGKEHTLLPGSSSLLLPHHMHKIHCERGIKIHKYSCMFHINILLNSPYDSELSEILYRIGSDLPSNVHFDSSQSERMKSIFQILYEEYKNPDYVGRISLIRAKLTEALLLFVRASNQDIQPLKHTFHLNQKMNFWHIIQYIHVHFLENLTLAHLSQKFHLSTPHISRLFKEHLGISFLGYLHGLRLKSAVSMLLSTDLPVTQIAYEAGFQSFRTFSRVFRETYEKTPCGYRQAFSTKK